VKPRFSHSSLISLILCSVSLAPFGDTASASLKDLKTPPGFRISVLTDQVPNARQMALSDSGILYVGSRRAGKIYAVPLSNAAGSPSRVVLVDSNLTMPSGIVMRGKDLYVGALNQILRYRNIDNHFSANPEPEIITDSLPNKTHHGWKYLSLGPDGNLYVPVGAPCNICLSENEEFASILKVDPDTGKHSLYAQGVRNTVGLAWHPEKHTLWFSDNGRDRLGDDTPAEELNEVTEPGQHFGYPFIHAGTIRDPKFGAGHDSKDYEPPRVKIQAHSAALGITFYTADHFPKTYQGALFIAEHGSWNRSSKVGYQVSVVRFNKGRPIYEAFASGWLKGQKSWGRPNDVLMTPQGELLVSDDQSGTIFRISYEGNQGSSD